MNRERYQELQDLLVIGVGVWLLFKYIDKRRKPKRVRRRPPPRQTERVATPSAYAVIGATPTMKMEDLRTMYRIAILKAHPDKGGSDVEAANVNQAWEWIQRNHVEPVPVSRARKVRGRAA